MDARLDVPANIDHLQVAADMPELCAAAQAARSQPRFAGKNGEVVGARRACRQDERVVGFFAHRHGRQHEPGSRLGRKVLQAVDRQVSVAIEHRLLNFAGEHSQAAESAQPAGLVAVSGRGDVHDLDGQVRGDSAQETGYMIRLPERQTAGACRYANRS